MGTTEADVTPTETSTAAAEPTTRTPTVSVSACHAAEIDLATGEFVLVLEDLSPCVQGDQLAGCTVDQAALAMDELAKLHAPRWNDPALASVEWLNRNGTEQSQAFSEMVLPQLRPGFLERYADRLTAEEVRLAEVLMQRIGRFIRDRQLGCMGCDLQFVTGTTATIENSAPFGFQHFVQPQTWLKAQFPSMLTTTASVLQLQCSEPPLKPSTPRETPSSTDG